MNNQCKRCLYYKKKKCRLSIKPADRPCGWYVYRGTVGINLGLEYDEVQRKDHKLENNL